MVRRRSTVRFRNGAPAQRTNSNISNGPWGPFRGPSSSHVEPHGAAFTAAFATLQSCSGRPGSGHDGFLVAGRRHSQYALGNFGGSGAMKLKQEARVLKTKALQSFIASAEAFNSLRDDARVTKVLLHLQHSFEMLL
jgi:hypothetical protein